MRHLRVFIFISLLIACRNEVIAQRYLFANISIEQGLVQSQATSMTQDLSGHLWVGTLGGLSRYDGRSFTNYSVRDGMPHNMVNALATAPDGLIWVGTQKGLSAFDGKNFRHYASPNPEVPGANVTKQIAITRDGNVYWLTNNDLLRIKNHTAAVVPRPLDSVKLIAIVADTAGALWVSVNRPGVLYRYYQNRYDSLRLRASLKKPVPLFVYRMFQDKRRQQWLCTNHGLFRREGDTLLPPNGAVRWEKPLPLVWSLAEAADGAYWASLVEGGACRFTDSSIQYFYKGTGLTDNRIFEVMGDREGNIWLASDGQGLYRYSGTPFTLLNESNGLPSEQIMAIAADRSGRVFFGTYDAGICMYAGGKVYPIPFPDKRNPDITSMALRNGYELWIGTRGEGLWRYNGTFKQYTVAADQLPSDYISAMKTDAWGRLWVGFINGAVCRVSHDSVGRIPLPVTSVEDFLSISEDSVLIATQSGVFLYNGTECKPYKTRTAMDSATVSCFAVTGDILWAGTNDNGLIAYNRRLRQATVINRSSGLRSDFIYNLLAEGNSVWAGTGNGIYRVRLSAKGAEVEAFSRAHGLLGMESNHNAVQAMPDGSVWFGTTNGALRYDPSVKMAATRPVSIVMQSVKLFGNAIADSTYYSSLSPGYGVPVGLRLPFTRNNLTFTFQAISLSGNTGIRYRYKIEGLDAPWSDWSENNTVTFSALPPGKHKLRVQCSAGDMRSMRELTYPFEIIAPFHKTAWFRVLIIGGCILLGVTLQYVANKRKQARLLLIESLRKEEQAKIRQRTAEDFHDEVGNKLTRINVLTNVLQSKLGPGTTPDVQRILDSIRDNAGQLYSGTRDILWSLKPSNDNMYEILFRIRDFGNELFGDTDVQFVFEGEREEDWKNYRMPMDASRNLIMIFKEALNNILKYAGATEVLMQIKLQENNLSVRLIDNGKGFDPEHVKKGHGIDNMQVRAKRINGELQLESVPGKGTVLRLRARIPLSK